MIRRAAHALIACTLSAIFFQSNAIADDCKLGRTASFDFTEQGGGIVVPVSLDGTRVPLALDTGSPISAVDPEVAKKLGLIEKRMFQGMYNMKGEVFTYLAVVHDLGVGDNHGSDVKMVVWPSPMSRDGSVAGVLGADLLRHYDIDIDFGAHKLNLFSQDHCPGRVVYWTSGPVAVVPVHVVNSGHIILPVTLDGHELDAILDLGSTHSLVSMAFAHNLFGLSDRSPGMEKTGEIYGAVQTPVYRYRFKSLGFEGLAINNPAIYIWDNLMEYSATQAPPIGSRLNDLHEVEGHTNFTLGLNELNHLHVYIAYKEQKLYISPASAAGVAESGALAAAPPLTAPPSSTAVSR